MLLQDWKDSVPHDGRSCHVGPDLQGFYSVPDCEMCFSLFIPRADEKKDRLFFLFFKHIVLSSCAFAV